ncbi:MAG: thioredoxin [Alphaproteobacteria bacterium]|nr:MAG: thioredoxin [Alphaproteobacteria bacterium]
MKKLLVLLILLAAVLFTAGCTEDNRENSTSPELSLGKDAVIKITQLEQINTSLQKGPVFVKIGTKWCPACRSMKPILEKLAAEYLGKATIAFVDADQNPELAEYFGVEAIPDSFVIVDIKNGTYVYMQENGNVSADRSQAKIIGLNDNDEKVFERVLDLSLLQQGKDKSN